MLSREAQNIYWIARYIERAENTARLINVNTNLILDLPVRMKVGWLPLVKITGGAELFESLYDRAGEKDVVRFLASDEKNPSSILSSLKAARENARTVREIMPREAWESVNSLYLSVRSQLPRGLDEHRRFEFLKSVITGVQQITGLFSGTMTHDNAYDLLRVGRNIERADMTTRIIEVRTAGLLPEDADALVPYETIQWSSILKSLSAYQMCRRRSRRPVSGRTVLEFLLRDSKFPRAIKHCMLEARGSVGRLPKREGPVVAINRVIAAVTAFKPGEVSEERLTRLMDECQEMIAAIHDELGKAYF